MNLDKKIGANDFSSQWADVEADVLMACRLVGSSGWYILGKEVAAFEESLAHTWGLRHAVATGNGMDALEIALRAGGLKPGERVLTTPLSAFASTLAILRAGGVPVFIDTDEHGLLDLARIENYLADGNNAHWLLPVHLYGHCLDLERLRRLKQRFGLNIVEDCAQSIGASSAGESCGTVGMAAATSFYPTKNLGAMGDGGAILTDDPDLAAACRQWRDYGQSEKYKHQLLGLNSRLDELQAAILRQAMLPRLAQATAHRRRLADIYRSHLNSPHVQCLAEPAWSQSVYHLFPVLVSGQREDFSRYLAEKGVHSNIHYPILIPEQPALNDVPHEVCGQLEKARRIATQEVSLPIHAYLNEDNAKYVAELINKWQH